MACDNPFANELTIDILVAVAADEGRRISLRTKEALQAYRAGRRVSKRIRLLYPEGVPAEVVAATAGKLGAELPQCRNLTAAGRAKGVTRSAAVRRVAGGGGVCRPGAVDGRAAGARGGRWRRSPRR